MNCKPDFRNYSTLDYIRKFFKAEYLVAKEGITIKAEQLRQQYIAWLNQAGFPLPKILSHIEKLCLQNGQEITEKEINKLDQLVQLNYRLLTGVQ